MILYTDNIHKKRIYINESKLRLLFEGNDNEKRAKNYIRQANVCENEEAVLRFFDTIRNIFSSSDPKSYAYRHIQGIVKMVLNGTLCYDDDGNLIMAKDGTPKLDDEKLIKLMQRINITAELEGESGIKQFDNSFRRIGDSNENTYDDFVDVTSLPSKSEYLDVLIKKYLEFITPTGYNIIRIPSFNVAKMFTPYMPDLCYLHRISKYNSYGGDNRIFLALKPNLNNIENVQIDRKTFRNSGRMNAFATSAIGIAVFNVIKQKINYELVTITSRYSWKTGATNHDYNFDELSKILGFDVKSWLSKEFGNSNIVLNVPNARTRERTALSQI